MPRLTPVHWKTLERVFLRGGFTFEREAGSHRSYSKPGVARAIVIPEYNEVGLDIIKSNMKPAGMTRERYFELLKGC